MDQSMTQEEKSQFDLEDAYFLVDNSNYQAFVPLGMIASLHTQIGEDGYIDVVLTTVSGKEFVNPGFSSHSIADEFCKEQMQEISNYNKALAEARNSYRPKSRFFSFFRCG